MATWLTTFIAIWVTRAYLGRRARGGHLDVELTTLIVAVACVVASRLAGFVPGYFYGVIAVYATPVTLSRRDSGRIAAWGTLAKYAIAIGAWIALGPLQTWAGQSGPLTRQLPAALAGTLFMGAVQAVVIGLVPLHFLPGATLRRWNRRTWLVLWVGGMFLFSLVLLHPGLAATRESSVAVTILLAGTFTLVSLVVWSYCRFSSPSAPGRGLAPPLTSAPAVPSHTT